MSGLGQRFVNAGYVLPKPLIEVDNKCIIEHIVNLFPGETNFSFICNETHLHETDMREILNKICPTGKIFEVPVEGRQGPVHAVSLIFDSICDNDETIVSYCDFGSWWSYSNFLKDTRSRNSNGAVVCYKNFHPHMLGKDNYAFLKETETGSRWMDAIQEKKPFTNNRMDEYASNGIYYFKSGGIMKEKFQELMNKGIKVNNEFYVSMVYNLMEQVSIFEIEYMLQWGTPYDLEVYKKWSLYFSNLMKLQPQFVENSVTTILPLAGHGSRFSERGYTVPKPLLPINGMPMVIQAIKCLPPTEFNVFICLKEHKINCKLLEFYPNSEIYEIDYVTEGQACTTKIGMKNIKPDDSILISACDNGVYYDTKVYNDLVNDETVDIVVWSFRDEPTSRNNPNMYAWMETDENDFVKSVSCKKFISGVHNLKTSHVIIGTMFFRKASYFTKGLEQNYKGNIRTNGEFYVDDVINRCIESGLKVKVFQVENYICWGTPDDYQVYLYWQNFFNVCTWHPYSIR